MKGATHYARCTARHPLISIHAPAKGATQRRYDAVRAAISISIHAPAKGATAARHSRGALAGISIHAPAKGATVNKLCEMIRLTDFNPRSREGSDVGSPQGNRYTRISIHAPAKGATLSCKAIIAHRYTISIHAPAKGATQEHHRRWNAWLDFNPRSREGSDVCCRPCHLCL